MFLFYIKNYLYLSVFICFAVAFIYLRYATDTYKVAATIKIADSNRDGVINMKEFEELLNKKLSFNITFPEV